MRNLVSIVVSAYNVAQYLGSCVESLIMQTYNNIEILLVDDGSSDATVKICDVYAEKDPRVLAFHKKNGGVSSARNIGISNAKGQFIMFVDGDDWLEPFAVEMLLNRLVESNADICYCNRYFKNENEILTATTLETDLVLPSIEIARRHLYYGFIASPCLSLSRFPLVEGKAKSYPRLSENKHPRFSEGIHTLEDWEFNFRLILSTENVAIISIPYYHYRTVEGSASKSPLNRRKMSCFLIPQKVEDFVRVNKFPLTEEMRFVHVFLIYHMLVVYSENGSVENSLRKLKKISLQNLWYVLTSNKVSYRYKMYILMTAIHPIIFKFLFNLKNK